jgi:hypothetical protein
MSRDVAQVFADIDAFDPDKFVAHLTPDAKFRFANADPVTGRAAVKEAVAGFFSTIDGLTHHITKVYEVGDAGPDVGDVGEGDHGQLRRRPGSRRCRSASR